MSRTTTRCVKKVIGKALVPIAFFPIICIIFHIPEVKSNVTPNNQRIASLDQQIDFGPHRQANPGGHVTERQVGQHGHFQL